MKTKKVIILLILLNVCIKTETIENIERTASCDEGNRRYYKSEIIFNDLENPCELIYDELWNALFFRQTVDEGTYKEYSKITVCQIDSKHCRDIMKGYAIAYDSINNDVYIGTHDGIYIYNFSTGIPEYFAEKGKCVHDICVGKNFYYVQNPNRALYVYKDGIFVPVEEAVDFEIDLFHISTDRHIYYANATGLFKVHRDKTESYVLRNQLSVTQITESLSGDIYFTTEDGIFVEKKNKMNIDIVAHLKGVCGLVFDSQERPIIIKDSSIYRLLPSEKDKICHKVT